MFSYRVQLVQILYLPGSWGGKNELAQCGARRSALCQRCLKEIKAVTPDQMQVLEILGKRYQSGHRMPIRMSKTTGFPGRNAFSPKRGGGGGGSKMQNLQEKRGSKRSEAVSLMRVLVRIVRVWARLGSFSSNPCSKAVQNDHVSAHCLAS